MPAALTQAPEKKSAVISAIGAVGWSLERVVKQAKVLPTYILH